MGEVYRARDTKLKREVALKVLPDAFAGDPERMVRFQREAEVLASLNHANIAQIYGVEERVLVMELVEGDSPKGPMPFDEAWKIAAQIAVALEYAHEKGIVHRDLKPANVKVTPDGVVKLLDFGLAKAFSEPVAGAPTDAANSPTLTMNATQMGVILGTAAYMSPEQAKGKSVDKRADIWAFGVVLYELLTGQRAFEGDDGSETLAQVLTKQPDLQKVPAKARRLLQRCLDKDPKQRLRDIGDAKELLDDQASLAAAAVRERFSNTGWIATGALALIAVTALWIAWRATRPVDHPLNRLSVDLGPEALTGLNTTVAISPDGRRLVFPARGADGKQQLATRLLDQAESTLLPGTEGGSDPFFSPDGQWIGFFAGGQLKKISVQGGPPVVQSYGNRAPQGASWGEDGSIVEAVAPFVNLALVPAAGGAPKPLTRLAPGEISHRWPQVLPGSEAVLFTASGAPTGMDNANIEAISLKTGQVKVVQRGGYFGRYLPSGHLVYVHQGILFGVKFDPVRLEVRGIPTPLVEDLAANPTTGGGQFDFSARASGPGTFLYLAGTGNAQTWRVAWMDSSGTMKSLISAPGEYGGLALSPDGRKLAFFQGDVYVYDPQRDTTTRVTFTGKTGLPIWTPDGKHIVYQDHSSGFALSWIRSDGGGEPQRLLEGQVNPTPWSFSPDGHWLAYQTQESTGNDLWTLPVDLSDPDHPKAGKPEIFLRTPASERTPKFSPDGRWIAYQSDESGNDEIYVRPFPARSGGKWQISIGGGSYAFWSKTGGELFFETPDNRIMVVDYSVDGDSFVPGKPRLWSDKQLFNLGVLNLDLAPDGKRFAVLTQPEAAPGVNGSVHIMMLQNFFDEVKRRIP